MTIINSLNSFRVAMIIGLTFVVAVLLNANKAGDSSTKSKTLAPRIRRSAIPKSWPAAMESNLPVKAEWKAKVNNATVPELARRAELQSPCANPDPGCTWTCNQCLGPDDVISCVDRETFAITFDDGPSQVTPKLLDMLDAAGAKATLFVCGNQMLSESGKKTLLRAFNSGHQIASHTWSHRALTTLTNDQIIAEVMWTHEIIESVIGVGPRYIRPPYGDADNRVRSIFKQLGYRSAIWNADTFDWKLGTAGFDDSEVPNAFSKWIADTHRVNGVIALQHDLTQKAVDAVPAVLKVLQQGKVKLQTVAECVHDPRPYTGNPDISPGAGSFTQSPASSSEPILAVESSTRKHTEAQPFVENGAGRSKDVVSVVILTILGHAVGLLVALA